MAIFKGKQNFLIGLKGEQGVSALCCTTKYVSYYDPNNTSTSLPFSSFETYYRGTNPRVGDTFLIPIEGDAAGTMAGRSWLGLAQITRVADETAYFTIRQCVETTGAKGEKGDSGDSGGGGGGFKCTVLNITCKALSGEFLTAYLNVTIFDENYIETVDDLRRVLTKAANQYENMRLPVTGNYYFKATEDASNLSDNGIVVGISHQTDRIVIACYSTSKVMNAPMGYAVDYSTITITKRYEV